MVAAAIAASGAAKRGTGARRALRALLPGARRGVTVSSDPLGLIGQQLRQAGQQDPSECDVVVVGGGSGGIACANRLAENGRTVVLLDHVSPSPRGTRWGFGGTCVNVGCIPKKLFHEAAAMRSGLLHDGAALGLGVAAEAARAAGPADWAALVHEVQNFVKSLNFSYSAGLHDRVQLVRAHAALRVGDSLGVTFHDAFSGQERLARAKQAIVLAVGGRPELPPEEMCPGARELGITSDDIFSLAEPPGKTLCVGGGYIATETAGFLAGLGFETTLAFRSVMLRGAGFDQQCAHKLAELMRAEGVNVVPQAVPKSVRRDAGRLLVELAHEDGTVVSEHFDTVLFGTGRRAHVDGLDLEAAGVELEATSGKVKVNDTFETSRTGVFAIGDCAASGAPELTPVAVRQGELLADALASGRGAASLLGTASIGPNLEQSLLVPSTVFAPTEYARVGLSEAAALEALGEEDVVTYLMEWQSLLGSATHRAPAPTMGAADFPHQCLVKVVCQRSADERIVGLHLVGPHAGEAMQGFALAVALGARKADLGGKVLPIHPTEAEGALTAHVTSASGDDFVQRGGCGGGRCG